MQPKEIVAVLAHELGHFKLHHVRAALLRSVATTGLIFFALSLCLPLEAFYLAFYFEGVSNYGALVVFGMWFGLISFFLQPLSAWMSRRNEFAADNFAKAHSEGSDQLVNALIKLRESNAAMPISHPLFSKFYHSHPPLVERIQALKG
jgi:STE24 endopeptidase